jgi:hypothetical protein
MDNPDNNGAKEVAQMKLYALVGICILTSACGAVRQHEVNDEFAQLRAQREAVNEECHQNLDAADLGALQGKVEIWRRPPDGPVPFKILANDKFPTSDDQQVIERWASVRDRCDQRMIATMTFPPHANRVTHDFLDAEYGVIKEADSRVGNLIVALYQQKLTYAEFASKRLESAQEQAQTLRSMEEGQRARDDAAIAAAKDRFNQGLVAWGIYLQALQARQPQTVYVTVR